MVATSTEHKKIGIPLGNFTVKSLGLQNLMSESEHKHPHSHQDCDKFVFHEEPKVTYDRLEKYFDHGYPTKVNGSSTILS